MKNKTVKVQEIAGEPLCYWVESWEKPEFQHKVDLLENDGNGACDCRDYTIRCEPNYVKSNKPIQYGYPGNPNPKRTQCRHIYVARIKFVNTTLRQIAQDQNKTKTYE